ncbi:MAG: hypothetical protein M3R27_07505 [Bacteroidota bacterium]|nr:hypothetical protein [Bacteroidota bacterium]
MNNLRHYFSFAMVAVYVSFGLLFLFTDIASETVSQYRTGIGMAMVIYGILRAYIVYTNIRREKAHEREN